MLSFQSIASSSKGNASLLRGKGVTILLDCGLTVKELQLAGVSISLLSAVFITHEHGDHSKGVKSLLKRGVDCYASAGTIEALDIDSPFMHAVKADTRFSVGGLAVLPLAMIHDAIEPLGFLIASDTDKLLFATDTGYMPYKFKGLTHLCIEANYSKKILVENVAMGYLSEVVADRTTKNHLSLEQVEATIRECETESLKETHLLHLSDGNSHAEAFKVQIQAITGKPVYVAKGK